MSVSLIIMPGRYVPKPWHESGPHLNVDYLRRSHFAKVYTTWDLPRNKLAQHGSYQTKYNCPSAPCPQGGRASQQSGG